MNMKEHIAYAKAAIAAFIVFAVGGAVAIDIPTADAFAGAFATDPAGSYTLVADIELSEWTTPSVFSGTLDGNGHTVNMRAGKPLFGNLTGTIRNIVIDGIKADDTATAVSPDRGVNFGLVAETVRGGVVGNVTVRNFTMSFPNNETKGKYTGALAGEFGDGARMSGCVVEGSCSISANNADGAGGLVGAICNSGTYAPAGTETVAASILSCTNRANIRVTAGGIAYVGGLAGCNIVAGSTAVVSNCVNEGIISTSRTSDSGSIVHVGGFLGRNNAASGGVLIVKDCANLGDVRFFYGESAGFLAELEGNGVVRMSGCVNRGNIGIDDYVGDNHTVAAFLAHGTKFNGTAVTFENCANYGNLVSCKYIGGFAGVFNMKQYGNLKTFAFTNCANYAAVTVPQAGLGGQLFVRMYIPGDTADNNNTYGAYNCFLPGDNYCGSKEVTQLTIAAESCVTPADEGYSAATAKKRLNVAAAANGWTEWVKGRIDGAEYPELVTFAEHVVPEGFFILVR